MTTYFTDIYSQMEELKFDITKARRYGNEINRFMKATTGKQFQQVAPGGGKISTKQPRDGFRMHDYQAQKLIDFISRPKKDPLDKKTGYGKW